MKDEIISLHNELKELMNESITIDDTIQIISQHIILSKVFKDLFKEIDNPIVSALDNVTKKMNLGSRLGKLDNFYNEMRLNHVNIKDDATKQNLIKDVYESFFKGSNPKETTKYGLVFTPIEVIDFIIHSTQHLLQKNFKIHFNDRNVKILDPFAGAGTFITRILQSGLITTNMYEKYKNDLYANEIILLAYYVSTINIETTYANLRHGKKYVRFNGMRYTDTFSQDPRFRYDSNHRRDQIKIHEGVLKEEKKRVLQQKGSHVHVIVGNPPYSAGQKDFNEQNRNTPYPKIDARIKDKYVTGMNVKNINKLYNSYIRALCWASDRIGDSGIIALVIPSVFLRSDTTAGIRASLHKEFNEIWCFDLRGNGNITGDGRSVFEYPGQSSGGTKTPVVIAILVKNPKKNNHVIWYSSLEDKYKSGPDKRNRIKELKSISGVKKWQEVIPDKYHDWLTTRNDVFYQYVPIGSEIAKSSGNENAIFRLFYQGVGTSRDPWTYNSSKSDLIDNMTKHITYCNAQDLDNPIIDPTQAKWTDDLSHRLKNTTPKFNKNQIRIALYRPFFKQYLYYDKIFNHRIKIVTKAFPNNDSENLVIILTNRFIDEFSTIVTNMIPDLNILTSDQCFPFFIYENNLKKENILDATVMEYRSRYDKNITKKDIFYYVYGMLHHPGYKKKFNNNLIHDFPHIPMAPDFWPFSKIGKKLVELHLNFEKCKRYNLNAKTVQKYKKIKFIQNDRASNKIDISVDDQIINIPLINYKIGRRTPVSWVVYMYNVTTDNKCGITNDRRSSDIIADIERAVYLGLETDKMIEQLPLEFEPNDGVPHKIGLELHT